MRGGNTRPTRETLSSHLPDLCRLACACVMQTRGHAVELPYLTDFAIGLCKKGEDGYTKLVCSYVRNARAFRCDVLETRLSGGKTGRWQFCEPLGLHGHQY